MAFVYLDSSVLVAIALGDPRGAQALGILGSRDSCTSALSPVECQAGLSFQYATAPGGLPAAEQALDAVLDRMQIIQVTSSVLVQARTLVRRHRSGIGLRTLDAIHVASCGEVRAQVGAGAIEYVTAARRVYIGRVLRSPSPMSALLSANERHKPGAIIHNMNSFRLLTGGL